MNIHRIHWKWQYDHSASWTIICERVAHTGCTHIDLRIRSASWLWYWLSSRTFDFSSFFFLARSRSLFWFNYSTSFCSRFCFVRAISVFILAALHCMRDSFCVFVQYFCFVSLTVFNFHHECNQPIQLAWQLFFFRDANSLSFALWMAISRPINMLEIMKYTKALFLPP